ncbi:MAG: hypothetical protein ABSD85_04330 [Acidimicrobiales bacterium]|jgi:hypothetical protein
MRSRLLTRTRQIALATASAALLGVTALCVPGSASADGAGRSGTAAAPFVGIVPPKNPPKNLPPIPNFFASCRPDVLDETVACNSKALLAIDHARATEPLGSLHFGLQKFLRLPVAYQLFAIADLERVSRGEPPVTALTAQLDQLAGAGALAGRDPELAGSSLTGGTQMRAWGSNWADGSESALGADDGWMYDDGYGSSNYDCRSPHAAGCWGHRDNILKPWSSYLAGCTAADSRLVMGAAYEKSSRFGTSFAEIFVAACGPKPAGEVYTWAQAQAAMGL